MHSHSIDRWHHDHVFLGDGHDRNARRTWLVVGLTAVMMVGEIVSGTLFGSMALLADGWHMATHVGALSIAALAYAYARRNAYAPQYSFGTGKVGDLAAFASAVGLAVVALMIAWDSVWRMLAPVAIRFDEAIAVAVLGLAVNLVSAMVLHGSHHHHHDHEDGHDDHHGEGHHDHGHQDHNLRAAYVHVLADALTSVLAIVGLFIGRYQGWLWIDPLMGVIGALVIARWSWGLMRDAGSVLLDAVSDRPLAERLRGILESDGDRVTDLHFWRIGPGHNAAVITLLTHEPHPPEHYKAFLRHLPTLSHVTIEVHRCDLCRPS